MTAEERGEFERMLLANGISLTVAKEVVELRENMESDFVLSAEYLEESNG